MSRQAFNKIIPKDRVVGEFRNKHGELFIVYRLPYIDKVYYVTGDELDWELGWRYWGSEELLNRFSLSDDETEQVKKLVRESKSDMWPEQKA